MAEIALLQQEVKALDGDERVNLTMEIMKKIETELFGAYSEVVDSSTQGLRIHPGQ